MAFSTGDSLNGYNAEAVPAEALAVPNARNERLANPGERSSGGGPAGPGFYNSLKRINSSANN